MDCDAAHEWWIIRCVARVVTGVDSGVDRLNKFNQGKFDCYQQDLPLLGYLIIDLISILHFKSQTINEAEVQVWDMQSVRPIGSGNNARGSFAHGKSHTVKWREFTFAKSSSYERVFLAESMFDPGISILNVLCTVISQVRIHTVANRVSQQIRPRRAVNPQFAPKPQQKSGLEIIHTLFMQPRPFWAD